MQLHKVIGRKIVPWEDDKGVQRVSVQLHVINESPSGDFEGSEVEIVKCNPDVVPNSTSVKIGEDIFIQRNEKGRATDIVPLKELKGLIG